MKLSRNTRKLVALTLSAALVLGGTALNSSSVSAAKKKVTLKLNKKKATVTVGNKVTLKVTKKNVKSAKITWKSSKKAVASVSKKGVVTGKKAGKAKITATVKYKAKGSKKTQKKNLTCNVTVAKNTTPNATNVPAPGNTATPAPGGDGNATTAPGGDGNATTAPGGDDATQAPGGDDATQAPGGDDATQAPGGDDATQAPGGDDATQAPGGDDNNTPAPGGDDDDATPAPPHNFSVLDLDDLDSLPKTAIETIKYKLNVTAFTNTVSGVCFEAQEGTNWTNPKSESKDITATGEYEFTLTFASGQIPMNLGYMVATGSSYGDFTAEVETIIINDEHTFTLNTPATTYGAEEDRVSGELKLDLYNVWDGSAGTALASDEDGHILYNGGQTGGGFTMSTLPASKDVTSVAITDVEYTLKVDSIEGSADVTVEGLVETNTETVDDAGEYTFYGTLAKATDGVENLGYINITGDTCSEIKGSIATIMINDIELEFTAAAWFGDGTLALSLPNVNGNLSDLQILAKDSTGDYMLIYSAEDNLIFFVQAADA